MFGKSSLIIVCCMVPLLFIGVDFALGFGCDCTNTTPTCWIKNCPADYFGYKTWCNDTTPKQWCKGTPSIWDPDCVYIANHWCYPAMYQYCANTIWTGEAVNLGQSCATYYSPVPFVTRCKWQACACYSPFLVCVVSSLQWFQPESRWIIALFLLLILAPLCSKIKVPGFQTLLKKCCKD